MQDVTRPKQTTSRFVFGWIGKSQTLCSLLTLDTACTELTLSWYKSNQNNTHNTTRQQWLISDMHIQSANGVH